MEQPQTTARDLMTPNPVSLHGGATVPEVLAFLTDTGFSAAPVLDDAGRPVGRPPGFGPPRVPAGGGGPVGGEARPVGVVYGRPRAAPPADGGGVVRAAALMPPVVFSVPPGVPAREVAREMVRQNVHRLF